MGRRRSATASARRCASPAPTSRATLRASPVVVTVGGRVAADLDLLGADADAGGRSWHRLDPRPPARRLKAAWRVGRLRVALPALADDLIGDVDADLRVDPRRSRARPGRAAAAAAALAPDARRPPRPRGAGRAAARRRRRPADRRVGGAPRARRRSVAGDLDVTTPSSSPRHPVLLSLLPPTHRRRPRLPPPPASAARTPLPGRRRGGGAGVAAPARPLGPRAHRRAAALALGRRCSPIGVLTAPSDVAGLRLDELASLVASGGSLAASSSATPSRAAAAGVVPPHRRRRRRPARRRREGTARAAPAAAGAPARCTSARTTPPPPGDVLVVRTLDPAPGVAAAGPRRTRRRDRQRAVAPGDPRPRVRRARRSSASPAPSSGFAPGTWVVVDGATGEVSPIEAGERE